MCEHAHVQNLPALTVYVDRQGEQPPGRGMDDPTCRDVPADGRRGVPTQFSDAPLDTPPHTYLLILQEGKPRISEYHNKIYKLPTDRFMNKSYK